MMAVGRTFQTSQVSRSNGRIPLTGAPGVYLQKSDISLNPSLIAFVAELRKRVPFDLTITSGIRSAERQGRVMWDNAMRIGGGNIQAAHDYLARLYGSKLVRAGLSSVKTSTDMIRLVQSMAANGVLVSNHMSGRGLDLVYPTPEQKQVLMTAIRSMSDLAPSVELLDEKDHFHIEGVPTNFAEKAIDFFKETASSAADSVRRTEPYVWLTLAGGFLLLAGTRLYMKKRAR